MGLIRLILLVILGALLYRFWRNWRARKPTTITQDQGKMLACDHCGLYFPEQDAVREDAQVFCSEAHRRAHRQEQA